MRIGEHPLISTFLQRYWSFQWYGIIEKGFSTDKLTHTNVITNTLKTRNKLKKCMFTKLPTPYSS